MLERLHHFVPGLGVDATRSGTTARLAVAFTVLTPRGCVKAACLVQPYVVSTATAGRTWSAPVALGAPQPLSAYPQSATGRFLGGLHLDVVRLRRRGRAVFAAAAAPPVDGGFRQGVYTTRVPPLAARPPPLRLGTPRATGARARRGARVVVTMPLATAASGPLDVQCRVSPPRARLALPRDAIVRGRAVCTWVVRSGARDARVTATITAISPETEIARTFTFRLR